MPTLVESGYDQFVTTSVSLVVAPPGTPLAVRQQLNAAVAAGGPIAFIAGQRLGAVTLLPPVTHGVLRLSLTWAIALVAFSVLVRRVNPDGQWPRYYTSRLR